VGDQDTKHSTIAYYELVVGKVVNWDNKKQNMLPYLASNQNTWFYVKPQ
jgi:hypothetical protein